MADLTTVPLTIAHQLPPVMAGQLGLSPHIVLRELPPERAWAVPVEAEILIAVPPRGERAAVPEQPPPGWPGRLRWVHAVSAGVDEYPPWLFQVPLVTCGRGTNSATIAEFTLAAILAVEKRLPEIWISEAQAWKPVQLGTLQGKTLGLLGYGSIGQEIATRARAFGMEVIAFRRSGGEAPGVRIADFATVLAEADHLVVALPLTPETSGIVDASALARLKPGAHLINIARGKLLDHASLLAALESGHLGFASLDVTEPEPLPAGHPLYAHPRVHLSPHLSWSGGDLSRYVPLFAENLRRYLKGETLLNLVPPGRGY
ncbi:MAG: NAD(P)-dependent oxidoreductase [Acidocella sp.]|nr:NAD(P)-dependent oxidoreductase [Acidocella sp.]